MTKTNKKSTAKEKTTHRVEKKGEHKKAPHTAHKHESHKHKPEAKNEHSAKAASNAKEHNKTHAHASHKAKKQDNDSWKTVSIVLGVIIAILILAIGALYFNQTNANADINKQVGDNTDNLDGTQETPDDTDANMQKEDESENELPPEVMEKLQPVIDEYGFSESIDIKVITKDGFQDMYLENFFKQPIGLFLTDFKKEYLSAQDEDIKALIEENQIKKGPVVLFGKNIENMKGFKNLDADTGIDGVLILFEGQEMPLFLFDGTIMLDGVEYYVLHENMVSQITMPVSLEETPKTEVPEVELFVMSHCPYGTQIEKGMLPVVKLLGEKIDFNLKFVNYAMHDKTEIDEQINQYCIENTYGKDALIDYLECFLAEGDTDSCVDEMKFESAKLEECFSKTDEEFGIYAAYEDKSKWLGSFPPFSIYDADNEKYGVRGSPSLIVNGVEMTTGRDSQSLLNTICDAFSEVPEECATQFDSGNPTPGFGFGETTQQNLATCG